MQTLALHPTTTPTTRTNPVDHTVALARRLGRAIVNLVTAPIERIARACDVAGVLEQRRAAARAPRSPATNARRRYRRNCWSPLFGGLNELT